MSQERPASYWTMVSRAWRLRCPRCGQQPLFKNWIRMHTDCTNCHLHYERGPGYFLGSIYVNYGLTAGLVTLFYFALFYSDVMSPQAALWVVTGFALAFPLWFFRYARSLWMGFDHFWDPTSPDPADNDGQQRSVD